MGIELCNGYYIDVDSLNFTLKKRYKGEKKSGEEFDTEKVCGYFSDIGGAVERFVKLNQIDYLPHTAISLGEYIEIIKEANKEAVRAVKSFLEHT